MDNNKQPSIHFPKNLTQLIEKNDLSIEKLTKDFTKCILTNLTKLGEPGEMN